MVTLLPVVLLVHLHYSSSTLWTMPVPVLPTTPNPPRVEVPANSMVLSMCTRRPSLQTVSLASIVDSSPQSLVSLSTVVFTLVSTTTSVSFDNCPSGNADANWVAEPVVLVGPLEGSFLASFGLGWGVTIGAGLASYPLDTIRYVSLDHSNVLTC